jgi:HK97 family phage prohead protease
MPRPEAGEDRASFLARCVEELDDGESDRDELEDQCALIWSQSQNKGQGMLHKVHNQKSADGLSFVLSDDTLDRHGDQILASGWQLENFRRAPIALFNHRADFPIGRWADLRIVGNALLGKLHLAPEGTSDRIDEIRKLVAAGVLTATSVGFRSLEQQPRKEGGTLFTKSELLEASLVSVPSNPSALAIAKGLNISPDTRRLVFTEQSDSAQRERTKRARELLVRSRKLSEETDRKIAQWKREGWWRI